MNLEHTEKHYYLLLLDIPEIVEEKIMKIKNEFFARFKTPLALSKPHITLSTFIQYSHNEKKIVFEINSIAKSINKIKIELEDYASYPTHTIYIEVKSDNTVTDLVKKIRSNTSKYMKYDKDPVAFFTNHPHIIIASELSNNVYNEGWKWLRQQHFKASFYTNQMTLLKRKPNQKYTIVKKFLFENTNISLRQGNLF